MAFKVVRQNELFFYSCILFIQKMFFEGQALSQMSRIDQQTKWTIIAIIMEFKLELQNLRRNRLKMIPCRGEQNGAGKAIVFTSFRLGVWGDRIALFPTV